MCHENRPRTPTLYEAIGDDGDLPHGARIVSHHDSPSGVCYSAPVPRLRSLTAIALVLGLTGPVILGAFGRAEGCTMCAARCCCKPPEGSAIRGACRLSRPCAAAEQKSVAPVVPSDPAVLEPTHPPCADPAASAARFAVFVRGPSNRTAGPAVPPPRT
jgi:hypothetical protein